VNRGRAKKLTQARTIVGRTGFIFFILLVTIRHQGLSQGAVLPATVRIEGVAGERMRDVSALVGNVDWRDSLQVVAALHRVVEWYQASGYFRAVVDLKRIPAGDSGISVLVCRVKEGWRAFVRRMTVHGANVLHEDRIRSILVLRHGDPFSVEAQEQDISRILRLYDESGYPFASVQVDRVMIEGGIEAESVDVDLHITEGALGTIAQVNVEGNTKTKSDVILRESRIGPGEIFTPRLAEQIRRRLVRMNIFASVGEPELFLTPQDRVGVLLKIVEGSPNRFDGIIGYVPRSGSNGGGYITGLAHVQFRNLFGTARDLALRWYRETERSQESSLRYHEPWVLGAPVDADVSLEQRKQDSTYVRFRFGLGADAILGDEWRIGASIERVTIIPGEPYGKRIVPEGSTVDAGLRLRYDLRDDIVTPTSGGSYETSVHLGTKRSVFADGRIQRFETQAWTFDASLYFTLLKRQVFAGTIHVFDRRTPSLDLSDLVRIGGAATVRGYREGQFAGTRLIWGGFEYRYLAGGRSFLFAFIDAVSVAIPGGNAIGFSESREFNAGYGGGFRVDTPAGLIGVSLAFGKGDTFSTAKLHVRLINEF
jgi:outer membrane protein assembly factor BamA